MSLSSRLGLTLGIRLGIACGVDADPIRSGSIAPPVVLDGLVVMIGDSIMNGYGDSNTADAGLGIGTAYTPVQFAGKSGAAVAATMTWNDTAYGNLRPRTSGTADNMGPELSFGRYLFQWGGDACAIAKFGINGVSLGGTSGYLPTGTTVPTVSLYSQLKTFVQAAVTSSGKQVSALVMSLGTNDSGDLTNSNAFDANLTTLAAQFKTDFGANVVFVLRRVNSATDPTGRPYIATIQSKGASWVAGRTDAVYVNVDAVPPNPADNIHPDANGHISEGNLLAQALTYKLRPARNDNQAATASPWMQAAYEPGIFTTGVQNVAPKARCPDAKAGDLQVLVYQNYFQNAVPTLTTANGFVALAGGAAQSLGAANYTNAKIWTRAVLQTDLDAAGGRLLDPVFTDNSDELLAWCFVIRGPSALTATNIEQVLVGSSGASTAVTLNPIPGFTVASSPAVPRLVLTIASALWGGVGTGQLNGQAQTGVTALTEVQDSVWVGSVAKMTQSVYTAIAAAGATAGTFTATYDAGSYTVNTGITLVIKP